VWKQRAFETGAGWLAGLTVCSQMLFGFLTFYAGMSLAVVLSIWTMRKGILGIAAFLCSMLPHGIVYLLIWYVLSVWSGQAQKKLHILPGLLLVAMSGAGAFLEIWVSPLLSGLF
jgi:stage II sporulation protein M